jgi:hypothetical protein
MMLFFAIKIMAILQFLLSISPHGKRTQELQVRQSRDTQTLTRKTKEKYPQPINTHTS